MINFGFDVGDKKSVGFQPYRKVFKISKNDSTAYSRKYKFKMVGRIDQIGLFIALWATFQSLWQQLAKFCKGVKICNFSGEIIFGQLLWTFGNFLLVTLIVVRLIGHRRRHRNLQVETSHPS